MTRFNMKKVMEMDIDGDQDAVLVFRERDGRPQDFYVHLPPFEADEKHFPAHVGTAIAIAACLDNEDKDFFKLIGEKFKKYSKGYLEFLYSKKGE